MRCPCCGGYSFDSDGNCLTELGPGRRCPYNIYRTKPSQDTGKVDIFKLAAGLSKKKKEQDIPRLSHYLWCSQRSLHYELRTDTFTCLNRECAMFNKPILSNMKEFKTIIGHIKKRQQY
jgi:hypothetical protein